MLQIYPILLQKTCQPLALTATPWQIPQICSHFEKGGRNHLPAFSTELAPMELLYQQNEIHNAAQWLLQQAGHRKVLAFFAPMGAGKTTLSAALLQLLGSTDHAGSPTFSIINEYLLPHGETLYHMDWYRLRDEEEAVAAGVEDALYSGHRCLVEWPEKAPGLLPPDTLLVRIEPVDEETRRLVVLPEQ